MVETQGINVIWNLRKIPIEKILSHYGIRVPDHRGHKHYKVFCPFHGETNPSFTIYPETNTFYCFSCSVGGGAVQLIREKEKVRFLPALQVLSKIGGYELSLEVLKEISQSFGGIWESTEDVQKLFENRQQEAWKKLTIKMSGELLDLCTFQGSKTFTKNFEWVWEEYEALSFGKMSMKKFDSLKDWFKQSKRFILHNRKYWIELEVFKREVHEEIVGHI